MPDADFAAAFAEVFRAVQPDADPVLSYGDGSTPDEEAELDALILSTLRALVWEAATVYQTGDVIQPATKNGHRYLVTVAGTSGAAEPTAWPTSPYQSVTSGTVTLAEAGRAYANRYDVREAVRQAWLLKAAKAAGRIDYSSDGASYREHQTPEFCERMARRYAPVGV